MGFFLHPMGKHPSGGWGFFVPLHPMQYDLPLVEEKVKPHQVTTLHLVSALAFLVAGLIIAVYNYTIPAWGGALLVAGVLLTGFTIFKNKWVTGNGNVPLRIAELLVAATVAIYSYLLHWKFPMGIFSVLSAAIIFALYWERKGSSALYIHISDKGVNLPVTSRKRFIQWQEIDQVVLRYDTLTIDCYNNQLFQFDMLDHNIDAQQFEAYCAAQVAANISKRPEEWAGF